MIISAECVRARVLVGTVALLVLLNRSETARAQDITGEQLLEALRTAIQTGDKTGFATLLEGASTLALGFVNVRLFVLRREIAQDWQAGRISGPVAGERMEVLTDLQSRLAEKKGILVGGHADQGDEPFFARFTSDTALGTNLPSQATLTLTEGSSFIVKPDILGRGIVNPPVTNAEIGVQIAQGEFQLTRFDFGLDSFEINGMPSGPNTVAMRPGTTGTFEFDPINGEFRAKYEGILVNDLYPETNPIVFFSDVTGFVHPNQSDVLVFTSEPMIVPGVPGEPPIDRLGMAYTPTIAAFDPASNLLTFGDNLDTGLLPDVSIVRTPEGLYLMEEGAAEPLLGASFMITPLLFTGESGAGHFLFADSNFSIFNQSGTFASGLLTGISIDPTSYSFTANVVFDNLPGALPSPFIENWMLSPSLQLLGPVATLDLVSATEGFTIAGTSPVDFVNAAPTPEPTLLAFLGSGLAVSLGYGPLRRTFSKSRRST